MKIKNIKINNYGNLENKEINLENKINIIYGKNESGKSTLLNYIKNIFYGISKNKNGKEISDYEKYKPWMKEEFSGKLKYELDNGEQFEIFRDFHKKNPKVFNGNLEDITTNFNIDKKDGSQFFYEQTKVDENMFLSTVVSMQQEVKLDKASQQIFVQKIANLAGTGDDGISFKRALDKLNKRQIDEVGTDRTQGRPINLVKDRMKQIELVIKDMKSCKNHKIELEQKKETLQEQIFKQEKQNEVLKKIHEINLQNNIEKEKINLKNKIKNEKQEKINLLNSEKNKLNENKKQIYEKLETQNQEKINSEKNKNDKKMKNNKNKNKSFILSIVFFILFIFIEIINYIFVKNNLLYIVGFTIILIYFICLFILKQLQKNKNKKINDQKELNQKIEIEKIKNEINIIDAKIESLDTQILQYQKEQEKEIQEIRDIQMAIDHKMDLTIEKIKNEYIEIDINKILDGINFQNLQNQLSEGQKKLEQYKIELHGITIEEKDIITKLENMIALEEEYNSLEKQLKELEEKNTCFILTKEYLNKAYEKMKNEVTPKFTQNLSKNMEEISNSKYHKVFIHDEHGMVVENKFGEYVPADRLSIGTIDQLYLSLRLSMLEDISEEKMPVILDEAFAYYDETRLENILKFLVEKAENHQLIIFTCTSREKNLLDKLQVPYNLVELS